MPTVELTDKFCDRTKPGPVCLKCHPLVFELPLYLIS
jgi:hypothetical protein